VHIQSRADSDDVNGMMAMVMIAMMIVLVMVNIVPDTLNQVDSVSQHSCKTFQQLIDFHGLIHRVENSTSHDVCISQLLLSSITLLCSHQADSEGGYKTGLQAEYQAGFRLGSDKVFKCQQALQWTPYCYNSHVVNTGIPPSLATSLI
jgi:competence protein ComGC